MKRKPSNADLDELEEQMRNMRKRLRELKWTSTEEIRKPHVADIVDEKNKAENKENGK